MQKIVSLQGGLIEELRLGIKGIFPEKCGLAAAINIPGASNYAYDILHEEDHRGEDGAGIISVTNGSFYQIKRPGSISEKFSAVDLDEELPGKVAIGQNRYSTKGDYKSLSNIPPFIFYETKFGPFALAHNGTLVDSNNSKNRLIEGGAVFQSTTDSELIGHLIAHSNAENLELAIIDALNEIKAAYSLLILTPDRLYAIRDRYGIRPLFISKLGDGYIIASENDAPDQYDESIHLREVEPGEMLIFEKGQETKFRSVKYAKPDEHYCVIEGIYFSSPRSTCHDFFHEDFRQELGREVFNENPDLNGDFILPVLDSGKHSAIGLGKAMGTELYKEYFLRKHKPRKKARSRSYIAPTEESRINSVYQKLHLRKDRIKGRKALVVDDTIIRLTTMKVVCKRLRDAGASSIIVVIPAPPVIDICPLGMDHQTKSELIAHERSIDEIRKECGADELIYLSLEGLNSVVSRTYKCGVCTGCFGGKYPVKPL